MTDAPFSIGLLETGLVPDELSEHYESYPDMFRHLLSDNMPKDWIFKTFSPVQGEFPDKVSQCNAWLVTGSKFGVYEDIDWIHQLRAFLAEAYAKDRPIIGICFGHQLLAQALGGKVIKSPKGWGCGAHRYEWCTQPQWLKEAQKSGMSNEQSFAIQAYHQDQVVDLPKEAKVIAQSYFCDYAALAYQDKAISFQGHPEFASDYASDLFELRKGTSLPDEIADAAIATKNTPLDQPLLAKAVIEFLKAHQISRAEKPSGNERSIHAG